MSLVSDTMSYEKLASTTSHLCALLLPVWLAYYAMAVLVQLAKTYKLRIALLPFIYWRTFLAIVPLRSSSDDPKYPYQNQTLALAFLVVSMRSTVWAFQQVPYRRTGTYIVTENGQSLPTEDHPISLAKAMWDAFDLMNGLREIGWNWSQKLYRVDSTKTTSSQYSVINIAGRALFCAMSWFFLVVTTNVFEPQIFRRPPHGTILDASLPPLLRYIKACGVTYISAWAVYHGVNSQYHLLATVGIIVFRQHPTAWPPLFNSPWKATSLVEFWGKRWHQLFKHIFINLGVRPFSRIFGRTGGVIGAFLVSGFLHDVGMRRTGQGGGALVVYGFFFMNAIGIILEMAWTKMTGRRVCGFVGWLWTMVWMTICAMPMIEFWARSGLMNGVSPDEWAQVTAKIIYGRDLRHN